MENAVEALKMAFAVLFFVGALTISMFTFSQARATSEAVLYSKDNSNFEDYIDSEDASKERTVGLDSVILTLYRYYKEDYTVVFKNKNTFLDLYTSTTRTNSWGTGYDFKKYGKSKDDTANLSKISSFDLTEETSRKEPWTGGGLGQTDIKKNLDAFINGGTIKFNNTRITYDGLLNKYKDAKFTETIGAYATSSIIYKTDKDGNILYENGQPVIDYDATTATGAYIYVDGELIQLQKQKKKRIITYTLQQ